MCFRYIILVSKLSGRYIRNLEDSDVYEATRENLGNVKRDILDKVKSDRTSLMKKKEKLMLSKSQEENTLENVPSATARRPTNQQMAVAATGNILRQRMVASSTQTEPGNIWVIGQYWNILMDGKKNWRYWRKWL